MNPTTHYLTIEHVIEVGPTDVVDTIAVMDLYALQLSAPLNAAIEGAADQGLPPMRNLRCSISYSDTDPRRADDLDELPDSDPEAAAGFVLMSDGSMRLTGAVLGVDFRRRLDSIGVRPEATFVDVVFDGPPGATAGRFVETEDGEGAGVGIGEWIDRGDGYWALRIPCPPDALRRDGAPR